MTFGPQLPPGFKKRKPQNDVPAEESEKEIINEKSASDSKAASDSNTKPKVSIGPQLPPHLKRQKIQQEQEIVVKEIVKVRQSIEKEEWGYGPAIPKQLSEQEKAELEEREKREMIEMIEARAFAPVASAGMKKTAGDKEKVVRREDWMLKPPEANRATTKLTSRTFSHKGTHEVDQSIWTSTPDTKAKDELDAAKKQLYQQDKARAKKASLQFIEKNVQFSITSYIYIL